MTKRMGPPGNEFRDVPAWDLIRAFLLLSRYGDYQAAAEIERVDDSTLRRRIRALELHFGRTLFVRNEGRWAVAPDLEGLLHSALRMHEAARSFTKDPHESGGIVRISTLDLFAQRFSQVFVALCDRHPRIQLNITTESYFVNLEQEQIDIAIRLALPVRDSGTLKIRKIGDIHVNAFASPEYLNQRDGEARNPNFSDHRLLTMNTQFSHIDHEFPYADLDSEMLGIRGHPVASADSFQVLRQLCELGLGVAILPTRYAGESSALEIVHRDRPNVVTELWLVSRFDLRAGWQRDLAAMLQSDLSKWSH